MEKVDNLIIGAGLAGSATARALARAGRDVVVLERFDMGHTRGSSHGKSRIFRLAYDDPKFVRMAQAALPLWRELESETGLELIVTTGGLDCSKDLTEHIRAVEECGVPYELLDGADASERFTLMSLPEGIGALFQPDAGIVLADKAVRALISSALAGPAELHEGEPAREVRVENGRARVATDLATYSAGVVVVTAGAWAKGLLAPLGIDLPVMPTRETVAYFSMADELSVPTIVDWSAAQGANGSPGPHVIYSLPSPGDGIKAGEHHAGPITNPDDVGEVDNASVARISQWVADRFPKADADPMHAETCIYTNTSNERFIIERHGPVVVGSACSGHGFKFGPLTGMHLAELVIDG
jgi:sarcosine oxidase